MLNEVISLYGFFLEAEPLDIHPSLANNGVYASKWTTGNSTVNYRSVLQSRIASALYMVQKEASITAFATLKILLPWECVIQGMKSRSD